MFRRLDVRRCVVCLLAVVMLGADPSSRFNKLGHEMMCACGCGQMLLECNHVGCPDSDRYDWGVAGADERGRVGHFDPELVCGEVWSDGAGGADSRRLRYRCVDCADGGVSAGDGGGGIFDSDVDGAVGAACASERGGVGYWWGRVAGADSAGDGVLTWA